LRDLHEEESHNHIIVPILVVLPVLLLRDLYEEMSHNRPYFSRVACFIIARFT